MIIICWKNINCRHVEKYVGAILRWHPRTVVSCSVPSWRSAQPNYELWINCRLPVHMTGMGESQRVEFSAGWITIYKFKIDLFDLGWFERFLAVGD